MTGGLGGVSTPVPFPNTAVKGPRGDDTAFKSAGKQRGANRFLKGPRVHSGPGGLFRTGDREGQMGLEGLCGFHF